MVIQTAASTKNVPFMVMRSNGLRTMLLAKAHEPRLMAMAPTTPMA